MTARRMRPAAWVVALVVGAAPAAPAVDVSGRVVDAAGQPLRDAVVFVETMPAGAPPPAAPTPAVMDQINKEFVPRLLPVAVGTEVAFPNHDQIHHHVYSLSRTKTFEIPLYKGEAASPVRFDQPGAVKLGCNIHDWMSGVILVLPTPYFAISDEQGAFALKDLPPGDYALAAWHEGAKAGVEATRQHVVVGEATAPLAFTIDAVPRKTRPRGRSYE